MKRFIEKERIGYLFVILAALLWAGSGSSAKFLFNRNITAFQLVQMRLTISSILLFVHLLIFRPHLLKIDKKDLLYFMAFGIFGMAAVQFTYLFAISRIQVAAAILLQYLAPSLIALYSWAVLKEPPSALTKSAIIGSFFGCYLVVGGYDLELMRLNLTGVVSGLLSAVSFAWYAVFGEYGMRKYSPWTVLVYALVVAMIVWNVLYPPFSAFTSSYGPVEWAVILYIGIFGTLVPFGLYLVGISYIRATRAAITATIEPIAAGFFSFLFLGEKLGVVQVAGSLLVIGSVIMLQLRHERDEKAPVFLKRHQ